MGRIFGTDGARGIANKELTVDLALSIGRAAAVVLTSEDVKHPTFVIGKDTRVSGDMLEGAASTRTQLQKLIHYLSQLVGKLICLVSY